MKTGLQSPKAGYVQLVNEPKTIKGHINPESFKKKGLTINGYYAMEINEHGALIFDKEGKALAMVDTEDIISSFYCCEFNGVIMPIEYKDDLIQQTLYYTKVMNRKGGYVPLLKNMVITHSLLSNKFNDTILWQNQ